MNCNKRPDDDINVAARRRQLVCSFQELVRREAKGQRDAWKTALDRKPFHLAAHVSMG